MEKNIKLELIVGVFILLGLLAFAQLALQVSGFTLTAYTDENYRLYAKFDNIAGITTRAKITMAGVTIGRVESVKLDPQEERALVTMRINQKIDFLTTDTSATILTSGLLGEKYIELASGADEELLGDGDYVEFTQSALVLENLIGRFLFEQGKN